MIVLGITGGLGTGKSTVAKLFGRSGAAVLDADEITHELMRPGRVAWRRIVQRFGRDVIGPDRALDRRKLSARVFRDPKARRQLEAIVHPQVRRELMRRLSRLSRAGRVKVAAVEIPLLAETGARALVDWVVVVTAPPELVRRRLRARGWVEDEVARRMAAQWDVSAKVELADLVIDNSDGLERTRKQVRQAWKQLVKVTCKRRASISRP
jgi:dephospho-CoA kinase